MIADDSPLDPTSAYGATKACVEQIARRYHVNHGLSVVGLRLGKVYGYGEHVKAGRGGGNTWFSSLLENPARGIGPNVVPFGDKSLDFLYVEDVSRAFLTALASREGAGQSFLTGGDYRPIREAFAFVQACVPDAEMELVDGGRRPGCRRARRPTGRTAMTSRGRRRFSASIRATGWRTASTKRSARTGSSRGSPRCPTPGIVEHAVGDGRTAPSPTVISSLRASRRSGPSTGHRGRWSPG